MHTSCLPILLALLSAGPSAAQPPELILVVGAAGSPEYGAEFAAWADNWQRAAEQAAAPCVRIGPGAGAGEQAGDDRSRLQQLLAAGKDETDRPLWLLLIGHGSSTGRDARFNLRGPDVTADQLAQWLAPLQRPLAIVNCSSSSSPFLNTLSGPGRVIVTATKSPFEQNYSRFGKYLSQAIAAAEADLDKDGQTSLLEAFLLASKRTEQFYADENRLATEHALIDDNGDSKGTPADWFHGIRPTKSAQDGALDGLRANQLHLLRSPREQQAPPEFLRQRNDVERRLEALRARRNTLSEDQYFQQLEPLMIEMAQLYEAL
jgi:hypothetical protein